MKKFPDWEELYSSMEDDEEIRKCIELLDEAQAEESESEVEVFGSGGRKPIGSPERFLTRTYSQERQRNILTARS